MKPMMKGMPPKGMPPKKVKKGGKVPSFGFSKKKVTDKDMDMM
jgi:hypothetical protein